MGAFLSGGRKAPAATYPQVKGFQKYLDSNRRHWVSKCLQGLAYCNTLSHAPCVYGAYGTFSLSLVSAGQAVVLIRPTRACGEFKKLSNQYKERGSVHGPLGHDALTPAKETKSSTSRFNRSTSFCATLLSQCVLDSYRLITQSERVTVMKSICSSLQ